MIFTIFWIIRHPRLYSRLVQTFRFVTKRSCFSSKISPSVGLDGVTFKWYILIGLQTLILKHGTVCKWRYIFSGFCRIPFFQVWIINSEYLLKMQSIGTLAITIMVLTFFWTQQYFSVHFSWNPGFYCSNFKYFAVRLSTMQFRLGSERLRV